MSGPSYNIALFDRTYAETVALLEEARAFVAADGWNDLPPGDIVKLLGAREALRLTTRLSQVLAWLLARRAVAAGEIAAEEAASNEKWRLGAAGICRNRSGEIEDLPEKLRDLLDRSYRLYVRVSRLDELVGRRTGYASR